MVTQLSLIAWASALAYEDWRRRRIPNVLLLAGIFLGLVHWAAYGAMPLGAQLWQGALAAGLGLAALLPFYAAGWMGAGDVKFCAVIGWLCGLHALLAVFLLASVVSGCFALLLLVPNCQCLMSGAGVEARLRERVPFGTGLAVALVALAAGWVDPAKFHFW